MPIVKCPRCDAVQYAAASYVGMARCAVCDSLLTVTKRQRDLATDRAMRLPPFADWQRRD
jgi:hypothetical protein